MGQRRIGVKIEYGRLAAAVQRNVAVDAQHRAGDRGHPGRFIERGPHRAQLTNVPAPGAHINDENRNHWRDDNDP